MKFTNPLIDLDQTHFNYRLLTSHSRGFLYPLPEAKLCS